MTPLAVKDKTPVEGISYGATPFVQAMKLLRCVQLRRISQRRSSRAWRKLWCTFVPFTCHSPCRRWCSPSFITPTCSMLPRPAAEGFSAHRLQSPRSCTVIFASLMLIVCVCLLCRLRKLSNTEKLHVCVSLCSSSGHKTDMQRLGAIHLLAGKS